jgi:hypothetical protein
MNRITITFVAATIIALVGFATPNAEAQSTHFDVELGYQWVDVDGNEDLYRTQINQSDGFVLKGFSLNHIDSSGDAKFADNFRIDAAGFGGNPAGRFRLWAGLGKIYRFRLFYSEFENFSALPAYANPAIADGVTPGQHTWDRDRQTVDIELELLPNRVVTPLIGYRHNVIEGPRTTTYRVGQNEYRLSSDLKETEQELYAGITFKAGSFFGTLIQGWREYEAKDNLSLGTGERDGNIGVPILGVDQYVDEFSRSMTSTAETPVTTANLQGKIGDDVDVVLSYVRADLEGDASSSEMLSGSLVSYRINRFFEGLDQTVASRTDNPFWRAEGRFKVHLGESVRLDLGLEENHRSLQGWSLISSLYLDTLNFGGHDPQDIQTLVDAHNGYERDDQTVTGRLNVNNLGPIVLWAEAGYTKTDLSLSQDVSEIVTPGGQEGDYQRTTKLLGAGAAVVLSKARFSVDISNESADDVIVRTDFNDRLRMRARVDFTPVKWFRFLGTAEYIDASNGNSGVGGNATTDHFAVDLNFDPTENLTFRLAWDDYSTDTRIPILIPQTLGPGESIFSENGTLLEGGLTWRIAIVTLDLGYSKFENQGSFEFDMKRAFFRLGVDFTDHWAVSADYENNDYSEKVLELAQYDATRYGVYLRWHR